MRVDLLGGLVIFNLVYPVHVLYGSLNKFIYVYISSHQVYVNIAKLSFRAIIHYFAMRNKANVLCERHETDFFTYLCGLLLPYSL